MKNLIYILIFLPSLLFSQETKNMELVGVRSETIEGYNTDVVTKIFTIDNGYVYKITNSRFKLPNTNRMELSINNELINGIFNISSNSDHQVVPNFSYPIFLGEGEYELKLYTGSTEYISKATISGLEFKLTTP